MIINVFRRDWKWLLLLALVAGLFIGAAYRNRKRHNIYEILSPAMGSPGDCSSSTRAAVIGDFGFAGPAEEAVASLVAGWKPDIVLTVGDNNYPRGSAATIDDNIGQYYHSFIAPYRGRYGPGAETNRFFPAPGNHDWQGGSLQPYLEYFTLPGNERYYEVQAGPAHFFLLDSDHAEPDGRDEGSIQAGWLKDRLAASGAPWKLVLMHHAPYSSSSLHGGSWKMQWPYAEWGASAVLAGHDHTYERLMVDEIPYFVNGLGGRSIYAFGAPLPYSAVRYNQDYGAMLITVGEDCLNVSFYNSHGVLVDSYSRH